MNAEVNYYAIILAGILSMVFGFLWYSPLLFGRQWMKLSGYTSDSLKKAQKEMGKLYGISFVLSLVTAYVLSHVITLSENYYGYSSLSTGLITAFWMWLGFMMPVQLTGEIFGAKNWKLFGLNTGYQLFSLMLTAVVLTLFSAA